MKGRYFLLTGTGLAMILSGCFGGTSITSVEPVPKGVQYNGRLVLGIVQAENRGMYLFNCIPLWSGLPHKPNFRQYTTFRNYLHPGYMDQMLADEGKRMNATSVVVRSCTESSRGWFSLWIVWVRQMRAEGVALGGKRSSDD